MSFDILILGSSSATPSYQRHPSAQILKISERFFLIDCGEGTQIQLERYHVKYHKLNHIFISHLHGDHYLGLMGLLSTMHLQGRTRALHLFAPKELKEIVDIQLLHSMTVLRYELIFHSIEGTGYDLIYEDDEMTIHSLPLSHRIFCNGFVFREKPGKRKIIKEKIEEFQIPVSAFKDLKDGKDYKTPDGKIIRSDELTLKARQPRSYAYCSDTIYDEGLLKYISGIDMLYHESTFLHEMIDRANETFHSTALQAAQLAEKAGVKKLLLGHFSARYKELAPLLEEARTVFKESYLGEEGVTFSI